MIWALFIAIAGLAITKVLDPGMAQEVVGVMVTGGCEGYSERVGMIAGGCVAGYRGCVPVRADDGSGREVPGVRVGEG